MQQIQGQTTFEGYVIYKNEIQNPNPKIMSDSIYKEKLKLAFGGKTYLLQKYFYKGSNYKSEMTMGNIITQQLYSPSDFKLYTWMSNKDDATYLSTKESEDTIKEIKKIEGEEEILGIKCKKLSIVGTKSTVTYWYNSKYYMLRYEDYKTHQYGFWNEYLKQTGAMPLKFEYKTTNAHIITTATEVKNIKLKDSEFTLPKFKSISEIKMK